jgi:hypothetical protein
VKCEIDQHVKTGCAVSCLGLCAAPPVPCSGSCVRVRLRVALGGGAGHGAGCGLARSRLSPRLSARGGRGSARALRAAARAPLLAPRRLSLCAVEHTPRAAPVCADHRTLYTRARRHRPPSCPAIGYTTNSHLPIPKHKKTSLKPHTAAGTIPLPTKYLLLFGPTPHTIQNKYLSMLGRLRALR